MMRPFPAPGRDGGQGVRMRIGEKAAGAVGGYIGGRLAAAGHEVVFFARGANLAALRERGLRIESPQRQPPGPKSGRHRRPQGSCAGRHRAVRRQAVGHREGRRVDPPDRGSRHPRDHAAERRRRGRTAAADPRPRQRGGRHGVYRERDVGTRRGVAHQRFRPDALRPRRRQARRQARRLRGRGAPGRRRHFADRLPSTSTAGRSSPSWSASPA